MTDDDRREAQERHPSHRPEPAKPWITATYHALTPDMIRAYDEAINEQRRKMEADRLAAFTGWEIAHRNGSEWFEVTDEEIAETIRTAAIPGPSKRAWRGWRTARRWIRATLRRAARAQECPYRGPQAIEPTDKETPA